MPLLFKENDLYYENNGLSSSFETKAGACQQTSAKLLKMVPNTVQYKVHTPHFQHSAFKYRNVKTQDNFMYEN